MTYKTAEPRSAVKSEVSLQRRWRTRMVAVFAMLAVALAACALSVATPDVALAADAPTHTKTITPNDDGTYTVSLDVTGKSSSEESTTNRKIDVVLVIDVSGSMAYNMSGSQEDRVPTEQQRLYYAKQAANQLVNSLLGTGSTNVNIAVVSFATTSSTVQGYTSTASSLTTAINSLNAGGGTNWEAGLNEANELGTTSSDAEKYIVFLSDGEPTFRLSSTGYNGWSLNREDNSREWVSTGWGNGYYVYGTGSSDAKNYNYNAAVTEAQNKGANTTLFSIAVGGTGIASENSVYQKMASFQSAVTGSTEGCYLASDSESLTKAFGEIIETITSTEAYKNVEITDTLSQWASGVQSGTTTLTTDGRVDPATFSYTQTKDGTTTTWSDAPAASVDSNGTVTWDLGSMTLEDSVTYTVSFTIAPTQAAYDKAAETGEAIKLASNGDASVFYTSFKTVNGQITESTDGSDGYESPEMTVPVSTIDLTKTWGDSKSHEAVTVTVTDSCHENSSLTKIVTLSADNDWQAEVVVAAGPTGHTYTVTETSVSGYSTTYQIGAGEASANPASIALQGLKTQSSSVGITNTRQTGGLSVTKHVSGSAANTGDTFTFTLTTDSDEVKGVSYNATVGGSSTTVAFSASGTATVTLSHNQSAEITGLPSGVEITVDETSKGTAYKSTSVAINGGSESSVTTADVTIPSDGTATVVYTNTATIEPDLGISSYATPAAVLAALAVVGGVALLLASRRKSSGDAWKE